MSIKKGQEGRKVKIANADRKRLHEEFQHYLTSVKDKPELSHAPESLFSSSKDCLLWPCFGHSRNEKMESEVCGGRAKKLATQSP